ncbi:hypothetical protein ACLKA6_005229 [Drosophila palustris]
MKSKKKKTPAKNRTQSTRDKTTPAKSRSHQAPAESRRERVRQPLFETPEVSIQKPALPETPKKGQHEIKLQQDLIEDMANSEENQFHGMEDHDAAFTSQTLQQLIQLLTLKAQQEGMSNNEGKLVKKEESFHEYVLQMKRIAARGEMDTESVIRYVVNGLNLKSDFKYNLYSCTSFKELREKYDIYEKVADVNEKSSTEKKQFQPSKSNDKGASGKSDRKQHCFNCGAADHLRKDCKAGQKCFRCNKSGHMSAQCTSSTSVNVAYEEKRPKSLKINNVVVNALVDTGADVSIVKRSLFNKMDGVELGRNVAALRGLGTNVVRPDGEFQASVDVDKMEVTHRFVVVADNAIGCDALLGYDFVAKFNMKMSPAGYAIRNDLQLNRTFCGLLGSFELAYHGLNFSFELQRDFRISICLPCRGENSTG